MFQIDSGVSAEDEAYVREGVRLAQDFLAATFGLDVTAPVTFEVEAGDPGGRSAAGTYGSGRVGIETAHPVWTEAGALQRTKIVVHEYFHLLQDDLLNGHERGPLWLMEGAAEYVAYLAVAERGLIPYDAVRDYHYGGVAFNPLLALEDLESSAGFAVANESCCAYSLAPLAVEVLTVSRGIAAITDYYSRLGRGDDPQDAFEAAFGVALEDFYPAFAVQRQGFVSFGPTHPSLQLPATFVQAAANVAIIGITSPLPRGEQGLLTAATASGVLCTLTLTSAKDAEMLTMPTHADAAGNVFWLYSTEPGVVRGPVTAEISCGGSPVSATFELI